jgi:hypothetical protein
MGKDDKPFRGEIVDWCIDSVTWPGVMVARGYIMPLDNEDRVGQGFLPGQRTTIRTSPIVSLDKTEAGHYVLETANSIYHLIGEANANQ